MFAQVLRINCALFVTSCIFTALIVAIHKEKREAKFWLLGTT